MVEALRKCFLALLGGWLATLVTASLQAQPQSGTYLILSGTYVERGGFSGVLSYQLPYPSQAFIQLSVPPATGTAEMTILQSNLRPMFLRPFTNGVVSSNQIGFHYVTVHPDYPGVASSATVDYTLTATGSSILLEGAITSAPQPSPSAPQPLRSSSSHPLTLSPRPELNIAAAAFFRRRRRRSRMRRRSRTSMRSRTLP